MIMMGGNKKKNQSSMFNYMVSKANQPRKQTIAEHYAVEGKSESDLKDDGVNTAHEAAFSAFTQAVGANDYKTGMRAFKEMMSMNAGNREYYGEGE